MVQVVCRRCGMGEEWWVGVVCWNVHYVKFYAWFGMIDMGCLVYRWM